MNVVDSHHWRATLWCSSIVWIVLLTPVAGWADAAADFDSIKKRCSEQYKAKKYRDAEHAAAELCSLAEKELKNKPNLLATAITWRAKTCLAQNRYAEAESFYRRALAIQEEVLGPQHVEVAAAANAVGYTCWKQRHYAEAEPFYKRALAIREAALGPDHQTVLGTLSDLALLYSAATRYADAEPLCRRVLSAQEKTFGPEHPRVAAALETLATIYKHEGRYADAEPLYKRALAIRQKTLPPNHPTVAAAMSNLGMLYYVEAHFADAEPLYRRALEIREKALGPNHLGVALDLNNLASLYSAQARYTDAEPLHKRALAIREKSLGPNHPDVAAVLSSLAWLYGVQARYAEAEPLYKRALAIREKALGPEHRDVAYCLNELAAMCRTQGRYTEAEPLYKRALAIREKALGPDHPDVASTLDGLGSLLATQGRFAEAEPLYKRAVTIREKSLGVTHPNVAASLNNLAVLYRNLARYADAEPLYQRALAMREKTWGGDHPDVAASLDTLAGFYTSQARYADAEPLYQRALAIREKVFGPDHPNVATSLDDLGSFYKTQARYAEAEPLYKRALAIREKSLGPGHPDVALTLCNLAVMYAAQGRYADAEPFYRQALTIRKRSLGPNHPNVAVSLANLAALYKYQSRYAEAEPLYKQALAIWEKSLGPDHPTVATMLNSLALMYVIQGRYAEAEPLYKRALAITEKKLGADHPDLARVLSNFASLYVAEKRYAEAESLYKRALIVKEKVLNPDHPDTAWTYHGMGRMRYEQGSYDEAESLLDRAIDVFDRAGVAPGTRFDSYLLRARIAWKRQLRGEAIADLHQAMQLAEQQRLQTSGSAHERAETFGYYSNAFEQMLQWQLEMKDMNEALAAMERGRARSLLDEMTQAGVDLLAGRSPAERAALRQRELELNEQVDRLQKQLDQPDGQSGSAADKTVRRRKLHAELGKVREALYEHYRDVRSSSPVYRQMLAGSSNTPRLSQVQRHLAADGGLMLVYLLGDEGGYLLAISDKGAALSDLNVDAAAANVLQIKPGRLSAARLGKAMSNDRGTGVVQQLSKPEKSGTPVEKLATLWRVLIPQRLRDDLTGGKVKRLIVVPDAKLALLPFETLVVKPESPPQYLLEVGPPILYGPSATVLYTLAGRTTAALPSGREPVLTVGNPNYAGGSGEPLSAATSRLKPAARDARYVAAGGRLSPLPFSGAESQWVAEAFSRHGFKAVRLEGSQATKGNVKSQIENRQTIHLACHGLADQSFGNFYGALALAPGRSAADVSDDGFLTLAEIYQMDLKRSELAILSACETNFGPQQRGEGVWALSRGFLVAGSRRVVASNWLVDDEAGARLIGRFCNTVAREEANGHAVDYAEALRNAKLWVRQQEGWESPFFWGTFVLVGPR
jgi:tetratricopeptide (TPR) repeat protein